MNPLSMDHIKPLKASLQDQQPFSEAYQDVYFSKQDGLAESRHVFIEHNQLTQRWAQQAKRGHFCIAETGFGTGLNFLATVQTWQSTAHKPRHLWFISVEQHPLSLTSLQQAHQQFPSLAVEAQRLQQLWGNFRAGMHCLAFAPDVSLMLVLGDAKAALQQLQATVDAWFLDGFAPSRNPEMWQDGLFAQVARLSKPGTTVATFTAASAVRKSLIKHGFEVRKEPGFGHKREMLTARFVAAAQSRTASPFWAPLPGAKMPPNRSRAAVTILGGGIAGLCVAHAMQQRGWHTTVIDRENRPMTQASGNALAMMMPLLTAGTSPEALFYWRAYDVANAFYHSDELNRIGVRQELRDAKSRQWAARLSALKLPSSLLQIHPDHAWYPGAGCIDTQRLSTRLKGSVDQWLEAAVQKLQKTPDGRWQLIDTGGQTVHSCDVLVVANGMGAKHLQPAWFEHLQARHGQTSVIKPPADADLAHVLLDQGYVIPDPKQARWVCGATYDHVTDAVSRQLPELASDHWPRNVAWWQEHPIQHRLQAAEVLGGHAALRATTADHLPMCGPVVDAITFSQNCADLHHGRHWQEDPLAPTIDNLYLVNGLGSRGFTSAPLLGQLLASMITQQPLPLEVDLCKMIHPNRFLYRTLKQPPNNR